jgi:hypothetical protein
MAVSFSGLSRNVDPYAFADAGSLDAITRAPTPRPQPTAGSTPSGVPLRQLTEPTVEQKTLLAVRDIGAGRDTVNSQWLTNNLMGNYDDAATPTMPVSYGGGGGGGNAALSQAFRDYVAGIQSGATDWSSAQDELTKRFAKYQQQLADVAASAGQRQEASAARAAEALAAIDPQAAFQYNVTPMSIGAGAGADYLRRIGASTGDVDAVRQFEQTMLNQMMGGAQQYSQATQRALDIERAARQAAVPQMLQEAQGALSSQQMAAQLSLSEAERRGLEDLLMRRSGEEQSIADRILEARLAAAEAGVTL